MRCLSAPKKALWRSIAAIAVPISLQSLFQSSLSVIDEIMVGQLGAVSITGIGIGAKFSGLFIVTLSAVGASASIMVAQYCGSDDCISVNHAFVSNGFLALAVTIVFLFPSIFLSDQIMGLYTSDPAVIPMAAKYLRIIAVGYIPLFGTAMLSAFLRNTGFAKYPMSASMASVAINTFLNYIFIFGKFGMPKMGLTGAAVATTATRIIEFLILFVLFKKEQIKSKFKISLRCEMARDFFKQTLSIASPIVLNEFLWGFGETMYAVVYGHIGTWEMTAMTLTTPIQSLSVGLFTGVSTAASIVAGNYLGKEQNEEAYAVSRKFIKVGILGSLCLGALLAAFAGIYVQLFNVSQDIGVSAYIKTTTVKIMYVFAAVLFIKVSNMILSGGILRSGGKTKYTLILDTFGTWVIGVPMGFVSAFIWKLPIYWVYFLISTEEAVRLILGIYIFKSKKWIENITADA